MKILCVNAGSSSLKFQMYEMPEEKVLINGYIEKIGEEDCFWTIKINGEKKETKRYLKNHTEAVEVLIDELFKNEKEYPEGLDDTPDVMVIAGSHTDKEIAEEVIFYLCLKIDLQEMQH